MSDKTKNGLWECSYCDREMDELDNYCAGCGTERPSPEPAPSEDERLSSALELAHEGCWAGDCGPSVRRRESEMMFLAKARSLLCPAAEAKGRQAGIRQACGAFLAEARLRDWRVSERARAWIIQQRDACGPAKEGPIENPRHVSAFEAERVRVENERLKAECDDLRAKLAEADEWKSSAMEQLTKWDAVRDAASLAGAVIGREFSTEVARILREQKARLEELERLSTGLGHDVQRLTHELEEARKNQPAGTYQAVPFVDATPACEGTATVDYEEEENSRPYGGKPAPVPVTTELDKITLWRWDTETGTLVLEPNGDWCSYDAARTLAVRDQAAAVKAAVENERDLREQAERHRAEWMQKAFAAKDDLNEAKKRIAELTRFIDKQEVELRAAREERDASAKRVRELDQRLQWAVDAQEQTEVERDANAQAARELAEVRALAKKRGLTVHCERGPVLVEGPTQVLLQGPWPKSRDDEDEFFRFCKLAGIHFDHVDRQRFAAYGLHLDQPAEKPSDGKGER